MKLLYEVIQLLEMFTDMGKVMGVSDGKVEML